MGLLVLLVYPIICGAGIAFLVYSFRRTRYPRNSHRTAFVIAFILGIAFGAATEWVGLYALGTVVLALMTGRSPE